MNMKNTYGCGYFSRDNTRANFKDIIFVINLINKNLL